MQRIKKKIFITGYKGGMAHLASCFSSVEILYALYNKGILVYNTDNLQWKERDRFVLSKGHAGLALYAVMTEVGLMSNDVFTSYLKDGGDLGGEPCMRDIKGIEASTGSLGHGLSMAIGMALGQKISGLKAKTYVLLGDGECQEGTIWEGLMSAPALKLDNLIVILDSNKIQKMDTIKNIMGFDNWREKITPMGWDIKEIDGHNVEEITNILTEKRTSTKPLFVIANTIKGKGVSIMENNPNWHFKLPNNKEKKVFMEELGISSNEMEL